MGRGLRTGRRICRGSGDRKGIRDIAIVVSDGLVRDSNKALIQAQKLKDMNVVIVCVAVGTSAGILGSVASDPDYVFRRNNPELYSLLEELTEVPCDGELPTKQIMFIPSKHGTLKQWWLNPSNAESILHKSCREKGFHQFENIIYVLVSSF